MAKKVKAGKVKRGLVPLIVSCVILAILIVALSIGNTIAFKYATVIDSVLSQPIVDEEEREAATASGQELAQRIVEEGAILLKNDNDTLPLSTAENGSVNVFGWHSIDWLYGTGGGNVSSGGVLPEDDDISKNVDLYKALNAYGIRYNKDLYDMYYKYKKPYQLARGWKVDEIQNAMPLVENRLLFLFLRYGQAVLRLFSLSLSVFGNAKLRRMLP